MSLDQGPGSEQRSPRLAGVSFLCSHALTCTPGGRVTPWCAMSYHVSRLQVNIMSIIRTPPRKPHGDIRLQAHPFPLVSSLTARATSLAAFSPSSSVHSSTGSRAGRWTTPINTAPSSAWMWTAA